MSSIISSIKAGTKIVLRYSGMFHSIRLLYGYLSFRLRNVTPAGSYQSMISLFCLTKGKSNDLIHGILKIRNRPYPIRTPDGVLGKMNPPLISRIVQDIRENGYHVFNQRLSDQMCDKILDFSMRQKAKVRACATNSKNGIEPGYLKIDRANPVGVRYDYDETTSLTSPEIQNLICDTSIFSIAQGYLECKPILDLIAFWWHTAYSDQPDEEAAQFYHFDMDRVKWLKFFFYITDVKPENGPHCFIAKSHRTKGIPWKLLKKGYKRLLDEEVSAAFPNKNNFIEFTAPRGTIIAEDTRGLHKGKHVQKGDRLIFQIEFCDSLFGAKYERSHFPENVTSNLAAAREAYPRIYSKFVST